jgi:hypothetical protein
VTTFEGAAEMSGFHFIHGVGIGSEGVGLDLDQGIKDWEFLERVDF